MEKCGDYQVVFHDSIAENTMHMGLLVGKGQKEFIRPGQFINIKVPSRPDLILRRPISINNYDDESGVLEIVYQVKGEGTRALMDAKVGESLNVLGPLGHGFTPGNEKNIWLIGGGIGTAPLRYLLQYYGDVSFSGIFGFRNQSCIFQQEELTRELGFTDFYTDDGSNGNPGFVTDGLLRRLESDGKPDMIYACGPLPMLRALKNIVLEREIPCMVSLEERMGCGMGVCVVCTCAVVLDGVEGRKRVCVDGPVFDVREVALHG